MEVIKIEGEVFDKVIAAMGRSELLGSLSQDMMTQVARRAELQKYNQGEQVVREGEPSDSFFMLIKGGVFVLSSPEDGKEPIELGRMHPPATIGEIGLLLEHERTATIRAAEGSLLLKFDRMIFNYMFENIPAFGLSISKFLAKRVQMLSAKISLPRHDEETAPSPEIMNLMPMDFIIRHRVLPLKIVDSFLHVGFVDDPTTTVMNALHRLIPGRELKPMNIKVGLFNEVLKGASGVGEWQPIEEESPKVSVETTSARSEKLDALLKRLVAEGASDLHLPAGQLPHWRIDGDITVISDAKIIGANEVFELVKPVMNDYALNEFQEKMDADFSYTIPGTARYRVNIYHDDHGISAAIRVIPSSILTFDQLGLPAVVEDLCMLPKGLVLVTGPSGSGKSTTLASMIDYVNVNRKAHIITIEDPVEFSYQSKKSLISQREVGSQALSFARGLRAAVREDPDVILVGEMRDLETISLALESANTGHLVFATLHTSDAVSTVNRIIDVYPPDQQDQVRTDLYQSLKGVVSQNLCKRIGGGRVAAFELLVVNSAIANMIRENKTVQIPSMMQTGRSLGHTFMNESLCKLVIDGKVTSEEALSRSGDKENLQERIKPVDKFTIGKKKR
ncbi:MAG: PilT/PilU family type 4a pilus ATPase [bacterium]|nr:PilT/PilU family type 4a pilus ATPase [bacterium]